MYYAYKVVFSQIASLEAKRSFQYWSFTNKQQRDLICSNNPLFYPCTKDSIPASEQVKIASGLTESYTGLFLNPF